MDAHEITLDPQKAAPFHAITGKPSKIAFRLNGNRAEDDEQVSFEVEPTGTVVWRAKGAVVRMKIDGFQPGLERTVLLGAVVLYWTALRETLSKQQGQETTSAP